MKRASRPRNLHLHALVPKTPIAAVRIVWILAILWYEVGTFHWSLAGCRWPDGELEPKDQQGSAGSTSDRPSPTHVLLVADPQVRAPHKNPVWRRWLHLTDLSLRKRWSFVRRVHPDAVVFLGDMLDNGRFASDDEYRETFEYFKTIFRTDTSTTVYYVPGNHDVGLGPSTRMNSTDARGRFSKYFGPLNNEVSIANHALIMLDAPGLIDEDYRRVASKLTFEDWRALPNGAIEFINSFAGVDSEEPVVLLSHIPLFRPDTAGCGPLREKGTIRRGVGPGFQNMLMRDTTNYILRYVRPSVVFSGNDHDYCEYSHSIPLLSEGPEPKIDYVREVTVKAISTAGDICRPGFQLLSLSSPSVHRTESKSFANVPCFFPGEQPIYLWRYLPLLFFSLLVLFVSAVRRQRNRQYYENFQTSPVEEASPSQGGDEVLPFTGSSLEELSLQNLVPSSPFGIARSTGSSTLAPTLRANAISPFAPHTLDFTVDGPVSSAYRTHDTMATSLAHLRVPSDSEDVEGDEEDFQTSAQLAHYRSRSEKSDDYLRLTLDRARRRRKLAWTWTFELSGRKQHLVIGVPYLLEHVFRTLWRAIRGQSRGLGGRRFDEESILSSFLHSVASAAWPAWLLFCMIYFYLL